MPAFNLSQIKIISNGSDDFITHPSVRMTSPIFTQLFELGHLPIPLPTPV